MKKGFIYAALIMAMAASCTKNVLDEEAETDVIPSANDFIALFETVTKTSLDAVSLVQKWEDGDAIGITTSADKNIECGQKGTDTGVFDAAGVTGKAPYHAVYPYSESNTFSGAVLNASIPGEQIVKKGFSVASGALVSACVSEDNNLHFKNCVSLLQITVPRDDIKKIEISAGDGDVLTGRFTMDLTEDILSPSPVEGSVSNNVTLIPEGGAFEPGTYFAAVIPGEINSVQIVFTNTSDETVSVTKNARAVLRRSGGSSLGNFFVYEISTAEELIKWAAQSAKYTVWDNVILMNDIALTEEEAARYVESRDFCGVFDGAGHRISGLACPLFGDIKGVVRNLELEACVVFSGTNSDRIIGNRFGIGVLAHYLKHDVNDNAALENVKAYGSVKIEGTVEHNIYCGGIIGVSDGCPVIRCENNASVTVSDASIQSGGNLYAGGIAGVVQADAGGCFTGCVNNGSLLIAEDASAEGECSAGGIAGLVTQPVVFEECSNKAPVVNACSAAKSFYTGGIVGWWKGSKCTLNRCTNSGAVGDNSGCGTQVNHIVAGIAGYVTASAPEVSETEVTAAHIRITDCENSAVVTNCPAAANLAACGGIAGYLINYAVIDNCRTVGEPDSDIVATDIVSATKIAMGGIVARFEKSMYARDCVNRGRICLHGSASCPDVRMGGIAGHAYHLSPVSGTVLVVYDGCRNYGYILNDSANAMTLVHMGGIYGSTASGAAIVRNCINKDAGYTGSSKTYIVDFVPVPNAVNPKLCIGGICGYTYYPDKFTGCRHYGEIKRSSTNIEKAGGIFGSNGSQRTKPHIDGDCAIGGNVRETDITQDNFMSLLSFNESVFTTDLQQNSAAGVWDGTE